MAPGAVVGEFDLIAANVEVAPLRVQAEDLAAKGLEQGEAPVHGGAQGVASRAFIAVMLSQWSKWGKTCHPVHMPDALHHRDDLHPKAAAKRFQLLDLRLRQGVWGGKAGKLVCEKPQCGYERSLK